MPGHDITRQHSAHASSLRVREQSPGPRPGAVRTLVIGPLQGRAVGTLLPLAAQTPGGGSQTASHGAARGWLHAEGHPTPTPRALGSPGCSAQGPWGTNAFLCPEAVCAVSSANSCPPGSLILQCPRPPRSTSKTPGFALPRPHPGLCFSVTAIGISPHPPPATRLARRPTQARNMAQGLCCFWASPHALRLLRPLTPPGPPLSGLLFFVWNVAELVTYRLSVLSRYLPCPLPPTPVFCGLVGGRPCLCLSLCPPPPHQSIQVRVCEITGRDSGP